MITYVHEGAEVKLTGREAVKTIRAPGGRQAREMRLVEITPVDESFDWKKWVPFDALYEVVDKKE